jgi:acetate kinase
MVEEASPGSRGGSGSRSVIDKRAARSCILTINGGSSSLKFALFDRAEPLDRLVSGQVERIGGEGSRFEVADAGGETIEERSVTAADPQAAVTVLIDWLERTVGLEAVAVIGHRVVHGGRRYYRPERITREVLDELKEVRPYDPDHLPGEIAVIEAFERIDAGRPQVACFDTAFHHDLPRVAQLLPIPRRFEAAGVRRYGFHGLSYSYLMEELERVAGAEAARGRVILAHLGSGASMAAVCDGKPVDTTMAFTPAAGLVMATRTGDLDPGLVLFLARTGGMNAKQFDRLVNHESGLLGLSETSADVRDLLAREVDDVRAREALEVFCYQARKWIGALSAALGGIDTLVFSGGIGENSAEIRRRICEHLRFLGIQLDARSNAAGDPWISIDGAPVAVCVLKTNEERMIARASARFVEETS